MTTLVTSVVGWVVILFLHVHVLRRDEVSRKKDRLQSEIDSLLNWALDTNNITGSSRELRETFFSGKISFIENRYDELYGKYFTKQERLDSFSILRDMDVYCLDDDKLRIAFQTGLVHELMAISDNVEIGYGEYCKNNWWYERLLEFLLNNKLYVLIYIALFIGAFFLGYLLNFLLDG